MRGEDPANKFLKLSWAILGLQFIVCIRNSHFLVLLFHVTAAVQTWVSVTLTEVDFFVMLMS